MASGQKKFSWTDKIINPHQLGGIETSILDNGLGRGTRIAWINTGAGLRYKVAIDRALDIVDAFYNEHSLAWLSHGGTSAPRPIAIAASNGSPRSAAACLPPAASRAWARPTASTASMAGSVISLPRSNR